VLDGKIKDNIQPGSIVKIEKDNQRDGQLIEGTVKSVLTSASIHPHGIKVLLEDGAVGRVKEIVRTSKFNTVEFTAIKKETSLPKNEDQVTEFKATFRFDLTRFQKTGVRSVSKDVEKSISKTIAAFMNARGGTLFIGIDDSGTVTGLQDDYETLDKSNSDKLRLVIKNSLESYLKNKIIFELIEIDFPSPEGKEFCRITVRPSPNPVFVHDGGRQECYVRVDNESKPYDYEEFLEYWKRRTL
jgi:uncharacterized repeat protein (TIGR03833 family)